MSGPVVGEQLTAEIPDDGPVQCPYDGCGGEVAEQDVAIRWNRIEVEGGEVKISTAGDYEFESDRSVPYLCTSCLLPVNLPAGALAEASYS